MPLAWLASMEFQGAFLLPQDEQGGMGDGGQGCLFKQKPPVVPHSTPRGKSGVTPWM